VMQYGHKGPEAQRSCRLFIGTSDCHSGRSQQLFSLALSLLLTESLHGWCCFFASEVTAISVETTLPC